MDKRINTVLKTYYDTVQKDHEVVFLALYGSQNYHLDTPESDVDAYCVVMPSVKELTCGMSDGKPRHYTFETGTVKVKTLGEMAKMYLMQSINFCETMFTPYIVINGDYAETVTRLGENAETIASADITHQLHSTYGMLMHEYDRAKDASLDMRTRRKAIARLLYCDSFMRKRCAMRTFADSLDPRSEQLYGTMMALKRNEACVYPFDTEQGLCEAVNDFQKHAKARWESFKAKDAATNLNEAERLLQDINLHALRTYLDRQ